MKQQALSSSWVVLSELVATGHLDGLSGTDIAALGVLAEELARVDANRDEVRAAFVAFCLHDHLSAEEIDELRLHDFVTMRFWPTDFPSPRHWLAIIDDPAAHPPRDHALANALHVAETARKALLHNHRAHAAPATAAHGDESARDTAAIAPYQGRLASIRKHRQNHHHGHEVSHAISVSIDMVGSTAIKSEMRKTAAAADMPEAATRLYRGLYREFALAEQQFYARLTDALTAHPRPMRLERCFVVKGIGDEQWLLIQPETSDAADLRMACLRVIEAAFETIALPLHYLGRIGDGDDAPRFEVRTPLKVYMDVIGNDSVDISHERLELFEDWLGNACGLRRKPHHMQQMLARLNVGTALPGIRARRTAVRRDLIGHEIDRLFRAAKHAVPGLVSMGDTMYQHLQATVEKRNVAFAERIAVPIPAGVDGGVEQQRHLGHARLNLKAHRMKGIDTPYAVHYLFTAESLHTLRHALGASKKTNRWIPEVLRQVDKVLGPPKSHRIERLFQGAATPPPPK